MYRIVFLYLFLLYLSVYQFIGLSPYHPILRYAEGEHPTAFLK